MTIKQLIVGAVLGTTTIGWVVHKVVQQNVRAAQPVEQARAIAPHKKTHDHRIACIRLPAKHKHQKTSDIEVS